MKAIAFSPAHITGFFQIFFGDEQQTGSTGGGISINLGSYAIVEESNEMRISKKASVARDAIKMLGEKYRVKIKNDLPVSQGFGISGASSLATTMAACHLKKFHYDKALKISHMSEIRKKTGLGDVIASFYGGMEARIEPGLKGRIKKWNLNQKILILVAGEPIKTRDILQGNIEKINNAGGIALKNFLKKPSFENFMIQAKFFSEESGILNKKMLKIMEKLNKIDTTAACMIGNSFFSKWSKKMKREMKKYGRVYEASIDNYGARIIASFK